MEAERKRILFEHCGLPPETEGMTFNSFDRRPGLEEAYDAALQLGADSGVIQWLTFMAGFDRGKTHLAVAICRKWLKMGRSVAFCDVPILLDDLRQGFGYEGEKSYESRFRFYCNVDLLILDDLGSEYRTSWVLEKLDTLVNYRYVRMLPMVVTTNQPMDQLPGRIASRLQRFINSKVVVIDAEEYRVWKEKQHC